jgi:hypothetical protein
MAHISMLRTRADEREIDRAALDRSVLSRAPEVKLSGWSADNPVARLAGEVLFLREQISLVGDVMELIKMRAPVATVRPGPHWKGGEASEPPAA